MEVLSEANTAREMELKRRDYFRSGMRIVWEIEPELRTLAVYTRADTPDAIFRASDTLTGGYVLPGFSMRFGDIIDIAER